jgi:hypothetical protein
MKDMTFTFGLWNTRMLEDAGVAKIVENAENYGLQNMSLESAIPILISSKDIDFSQLVPFTDIADDMTPVTFAPGVRTLYPASGRHRVTALGILREKADKVLPMVRKQLAAIADSMDVDEDDGPKKKKKGKAVVPSESKIEELKRQKTKWEAMKLRFDYWLCAFYDIGEQSIASSTRW